MMQRQTPDALIERRLAEHGVRFTGNRRVVVQALLRADGPRSAAELHADLEGSIPLSTLYRSLAVLEDSEVLDPHHGTRGVTRYELGEWLRGHHHHLVCLDCGSVEDIHLTADQEKALASLVSRVAGAAGFEPYGHSLDIDGLCSKCA